MDSLYEVSRKLDRCDLVVREAVFLVISRMWVRFLVHQKFFKRTCLSKKLFGVSSLNNQNGGAE